MSFERLGEQSEERAPDFVPQAHCAVCGVEASITLYDVTNTFTGIVERGAASQFCQYDKIGNVTGRARAGYQVGKAYGFCGTCYMGEKREKGPAASPEVAAAWRFAIDHWDRESLDADHPRCDHYLEILNRQVARSGNYDALPPICRLDHILRGRAA